MRFFDLHSDPVQCASERATLCLFLRGDMPPLPREAEHAETWRESDLLACAIGAPQYGSARKGVSAWERRVGARLAAGAEAPTASGPTEVGPSDIGAITNHSSLVTCHSSLRDGAFRVVTDRTCGGFAESGALECGPLRFEIVESQKSKVKNLSATNHLSLVTRHSSLRGGASVAATVWASSLDGAPLATSRRILLAHVTDAANTGAVFDGPEAHSWMEQGTTPALARRGRAGVELRFDNRELRAGKAGNDGAAGAANDDGAPRQMTKSLQGAASPAVFRLSLTGLRIAEVPSTFDPAASTLSFTADTGYDPACATFFYEIVR
jgi:hypothetical protein